MPIFLIKEPFWLDGFSNMNRDEFLLEKSAQLDSKSCFLRIYGWSNPSVSIGKNQLVSSLDLQKLQADKIDLVRRVTGGGAVWHDKNQITYSISAPSNSIFFGNTIESSFSKIADCLLSFAQNFLVEEQLKIGFSSSASFADTRISSYVCFSSLGLREITIRNKKWIGSAQRRTNNSFIQHGSIILEPSQEKLCQYYLGDVSYLGKKSIKEIGIWDFCSQQLCIQLQENLNLTGIPQKILGYLQQSFESVLGEQIYLYDLAQ